MKKALGVLLLALATITGWAADSEPDLLPMDELRKLSLEELMRIDVVVTSVGKKPQKLFETAAAVFVITPEDIRRSGVTSIPEALRMVPGVQVAHIDASKWAISARGFNGRFSNKLLVLIDGRSVYTPLFSGVFWDEQDTLLEDIARIEVIRGPGATLWGANAVNGVINIITKQAKDTQGTLITAGAGTEERGFGGVRYGGSLGKAAYYRVYGKYFNRDEFTGRSGPEAADDWAVSRGGFRVDWDASGRDALTLQGDIYAGRAGQTLTFAALTPPFVQTKSLDVSINGGNLLGRWTHSFSPTSTLALQLYYDRTDRDNPSQGKQIRDTLDIDFQHDFGLGKRHDIIWGLGYWFSSDDTEGSFSLSSDTENRGLNLFSAFVQDDVTLVEDRLRLTLGAKFEYNDFTGFEVQPNARLLWTPYKRHALWGAISRALRTPSRINQDVRFNQRVIPGDPPVVLSLFGNSDFDSEELLAFELGYRVQPMDRLFADIAAFYNVYDRLRTFEPGVPFLETSPLSSHRVRPFFTANKMDGEAYGVELALDWEPLDGWRLQAVYSYLQIQLHVDGDSGDTISEAAEGESPKHQFSLRSSMDLYRDLALDLWLRYVDNLPSLAVGSYLTLDARLGWKPHKNLELSVVGQNLLDRQHPEFVGEFFDILPTQVERGVYAKLDWRF